MAQTLTAQISDKLSLPAPRYNVVVSSLFLSRWFFNYMVTPLLLMQTENKTIDIMSKNLKSQRHSSQVLVKLRAALW